MLAEDLIKSGRVATPTSLTLQNQLVPLLSDQLYRSPIKAVEELIVNSYDAGAKECRIYVPTSNELESGEGHKFIVVFDDGAGMSMEEISPLWMVGYSPKRSTRNNVASGQRKQIGKFGIGKLATYAVANHLTYITKSHGQILVTSLDFTELDADASTETKKVSIPTTIIDKVETLFENKSFSEVCSAISVPLATLSGDSWTFVVLEDLKPKAKDIKQGRLEWVLSTAMPLKADFSLFNRGNSIRSSKEELAPVVRFNISDLPDNRIQSLNKSTGQDWKLGLFGLSSRTFPSGVNGEVLMTKDPLYGGKSDDLVRSHGFFIRVRDRVVNLEDPLFGLREFSYKYFHRMRVEVNADDLDSGVVAAREGIELSDDRSQLVHLMKEVFQEARSRFDKYEVELLDKTRNKTEYNREYVSPKHVEYPLADVLTDPGALTDGAEADRTWFYIEVPSAEQVHLLAEKLYSGKRSGYNFRYSSSDRRDRMVRFNPEESLFSVNTEHEFVRKHYGGESESCLEDFAIAETLLEVYLREERVPTPIIGEILEKRDELLRSLANDEFQSPTRIAQFLEDSACDQYDLEIGLVIAARALGFSAKQISGSDQPDGVATWFDHPHGIRRITLEAKSTSSEKGPSLSAIDFATLETHQRDHEASGCLLLAPSYPGDKRKSGKARAAKNASSCKVSCWTISDLGRVVIQVCARHITAKDILQIIESAFEPEDVKLAVEKLLNSSEWTNPNLYGAVLDALEHLEDKLSDSVRTLDLVASVITHKNEFADIKKAEIDAALRDLSGASRGSLRYNSDGQIKALTAIEEIRRRVSAMIGSRSISRKPGSFRNGESPTS